jgi:hypothetical protein
VSNRLVLLSGTPRAGTSTIAAACAQVAEQAGYQTHLIRVSDINMLEERHAAWSHIIGMVQDWVRVEGLELPSADSLVTVPGVDDFLLLRAAAREIRQRTDITIVDAGQIDEFLRLVTWLETLDRLGIASPWLRGEIARIVEVLFDAQATIRIVTTPDDADEGVAAIAGASLAGFHVDGLIINRVPRKKDDWPKAWVKDQRARAKSVNAGDIPVSRVALGSITLSLARHCGLDTAWTPSPRASVEASGTGYRWSIPLIDPAHQQVRVGQLDRQVLIEVGPYRRAFAMPSVIQRCTITRADVNTDHVSLWCEPNPDVWPA